MYGERKVYGMDEAVSASLLQYGPGSPSGRDKLLPQVTCVPEGSRKPHMSTSALRAIPQANDPATPAGTPGPATHMTLVENPPAPKPVRKPARRSHADAIAIAISCAAPLVLTAWGWSYYGQSFAGRLRNPLHALLKPSGPVGLALGAAGLALFLFMWLYPFRKSVKWLAWTGPLGSWMRVHVVAGLAIPLIVAVHAGWRFDGLIGLGYLSMFVVSLSGIVGRYLYVHIPRRRNGLEMSMEEVASERRAIITTIAAASGLVPAEVERRLAVDARPYEGLDPLRTLLRMVRDDLSRGRVLRQLQRELSAPRAGAAPLDGGQLRDTLRLARQELRLSQQVRMLEATRRVFGFWHVAHRPFAITALIAVIVHVVVAVMFGGVGLSLGH